MRKAEAFTFRDERLTEVAFPLGGIGAGCVSLEGRGALRDWEIYGRPNKNSVLENTFAALRWQAEGGAAGVRVLQGPRLKEFGGLGSALGTGHLHQGEGLPCFDEATFHAGFPFAHIELRGEGCPVEVDLEAFSPFWPHADREASMPAASLTYKVRNAGDQPLELMLAWTMHNPVPSEPGSPETEAGTRFQRSDAVSGLIFENGGSPDSSCALTTDWREVVACERWLDTGWFDALQDFWNHLERGELPPTAQGSGRRVPATLGLRARLAPGEQVALPILLTWCFPWADRYWDTQTEPAAGTWKRWYATQWPDAWAAAAEFHARRDELESESRAFQTALAESDLPDEVVASVAFTCSTLRTPTVDRLEDGTLWAWEGCHGTSGCCHGSCSHVWNYALTHAYLFPKLANTMLASHFERGFHCGPQGRQGAMNFRIMLPVEGGSPLWHAAIDGQLGLVMQLCRTWKHTGDAELLRRWWPLAKRALEFAWVQWDRDQDGLVEGDMHNTYDINFQGPNPLGQFFYLGALRAGVEMAEACGEPESAATYRRLAEAGEHQAMDELWNGAYFEQRLEPFGEQPPKYQHGIGCLSDQVLGALDARLAGLPEPCGEEVIGRALDAVFTHNFRDPIGNHVNLQRSYASRDEAGLLLCSWPKGGRPEYPFVYSDEVWTGIEYQVATHLAFHGRTEQALRMVAAVRRRYDGRRRNPYNEVECGNHYARALASYGLVLAWPRTGTRLYVDGTSWGVESLEGVRSAAEA